MKNFTEKEITKTSKFLSLILRHKPEEVGIVLDSKGRVKIETLLKATNITREELDIVVSKNNKKRFVIDGEYIYAAQGHSIKNINIELEEKEPPEFLYHGTFVKNINSIIEKGIIANNRNHVHLSIDIETAKIVGLRHGSPVVLKIAAKSMYNSGNKFYISKNNVWLTNFILPEYIKLDELIYDNKTRNKI